MNLIVAVDKNWAIGNKGELLVRIPADHKMFRQETIGKVVVLGRKTMDTFPGGQPLKNRDNIILSRNEAYQQKDAQVVHSVEELLEAVKGYDTKEVYVIGGSSVYEQLLPYCDVAHVTCMDYSYQLTMPMKRMRGSRIWTRIRTGRSQLTVTSSITLT